MEAWQFMTGTRPCLGGDLWQEVAGQASFEQPEQGRAIVFILHDWWSSCNLVQDVGVAPAIRIRRHPSFLSAGWPAVSGPVCSPGLSERPVCILTAHLADNCHALVPPSCSLASSWTY
ncbi:hypothetical protein CDEST_08560 [Colletotrichum destructivum]|uniref:Uncharacterized protein n=1 Tax=Colletotrichum destructivum TaxID=34406 RepID=A0AAX4IKV3_9PEZI|nr:hypothetical protein CDEST_08560 [Colletotrichum destructivum]